METGVFKEWLRGAETFEEALMDTKLNPTITAAFYQSAVLERLAEAIEKMNL